MTDIRSPKSETHDVEVLAVVGGVTYRQVITVTYINPKGKATLTTPKK